MEVVISSTDPSHFWYIGRNWPSGPAPGDIHVYQSVHATASMYVPIDLYGYLLFNHNYFRGKYSF
jgi:hypothetical protein